MSELIIEPFGKRHDRSSFSCGTPELDRYIRQQAGQDLKRRVSTVFVAVKGEMLIGFYTLSATVIGLESLPHDIARKLPKYPVPAVLLGRLAVDKDYQGEKIGKALMVNAMKRVCYASASIGINVMAVDAKNEDAVGFYRRFGFIHLVDSRSRLFLPVATIEEAMGE